MRNTIDWQDLFGLWHRNQTKQKEADASRVAQFRARKTGNRYKLADENENFLDLETP
jgi:hypothetical protein